MKKARVPCLPLLYNSCFSFYSLAVKAKAVKQAKLYKLS
nr:hypothetical protein [Fusarium oxysporum]